MRNVSTESSGSNVESSGSDVESSSRLRSRPGRSKTVTDKTNTVHASAKRSVDEHPRSCRYKSELETAKETIRKQDAEIKALKAENADFRQTDADLKKQNATLIREKAEQVETIKKCSKLISSLKEDRIGMRLDVSGLSKRISDMGKLIQALKIQVDETEESMEKKNACDYIDDARSDDDEGEGYGYACASGTRGDYIGDGHSADDGFYENDPDDYRLY